MHILNVSTATLDDLVEPVDLGQRPAPMAALSFSDSDLAALAGAGPDAILVPKVRSSDALITVGARLRRLGAPAATRIWAMIETPVAILDALSIARGSARLGAFVLGTNDLVKELYAEHVPGRAPILPSLHTALLAGLLSHIGLRLEPGREYQGTRGSKFVIWPGSALAKSPPKLVVAAELIETSRLWGRLAAAIDDSACPECGWSIEVKWSGVGCVHCAWW